MRITSFALHHPGVVEFLYNLFTRIDKIRDEGDASVFEIEHPEITCYAAYDMIFTSDADGKILSGKLVKV